MLLSLVQFVAGYRVVLYTDSQAAWAIWLGGSSRSEDCHRVVVDIFWLCLEHGIVLDVIWVPRELDKYADYLAGIYDKDDWQQLHSDWFGWLESLWGWHTINRFVTEINHICPTVFNSAWWCPGTSGVDCLARRDWAQFNNWCNPPFKLIGNKLLRVLRD